MVVFHTRLQQLVPPVDAETYFSELFTEQLQVRLPVRPTMLVGCDVQTTGYHYRHLVKEGQVILFGPQPNCHLTRQPCQAIAGHTRSVGQQCAGNGETPNKLRYN